MTDLPSPSAPVPPTVVEVYYPPSRGKIGIRGSHAPLSWDHTQGPDEQDGDKHVFRIALPRGELLELKVVRNEEEWAGGRNYPLHDGENIRIEPYFEQTSVRLEDA